MTKIAPPRIRLLSLLTLTALLAGCGNRIHPLPRRLADLEEPSLADTLRKSLNATGSVQLWDNWQSLDAAVITTAYDQDQGQLLLRQTITGYADGNLALTLTTERPEGRFIEKIDNKRHVSVLRDAQDALYENTDPQDRYATAVKLRLILHALSPATLLDPDLNLRYVTLERKGGRPMHKIEVAGKLFADAKPFAGALGDLLIVWIDAETYRIRRLWIRYQISPTDFQYLALNVNQYEQTDSGLFFPTLLELARSDHHQQESANRIFTSELMQTQAGVSQP